MSRIKGFRSVKGYADYYKWAVKKGNNGDYFDFMMQDTEKSASEMMKEADFDAITGMLLTLNDLDKNKTTKMLQEVLKRVKSLG